MTAVVLPLRSLLFVPATRLERIEKAINTGADAVVVDWEDAVADADKVQARAATIAYLATQPAIKVWVRVNAA
ncbi:MAG: aldolase/citrate lyase family protein, partial [Neisseriaceae bacterium]